MKTSDNIQIKYRKDYQPSNYFIDTVNLKIELLEGYSLVHSELVLVSNSLATDSSTLELDGEQLELLSIAVDGIPLDKLLYQVTDTNLILKKCPKQFRLSLSVKVYPEKNTSLEGLYLSSNKYCTQCEAQGFRKITYYLDRPDIMALFEVRIEANKQMYPFLLSNGNKIDSGDLDGGRHYVVWQDPFKKPSYLFALCAGDYDLLEDHFTTQSGKEVLLQIFVDQGKLQQCSHAMQSLKKSMAWDEKVYNLEYDLDIYMIVAVGDFNMGAMENKGLNVFNTKYVLASQDTATDQDFEDVEAVIGHEYFHNWTGNRVTCRDWFQLSLKEGLTVFRDQQFTADQTDQAVKRIADVKVIRSHQFAEDGGPMAHPIRPESYIEMNNFYTVTVYNKGAEIIRMYHTLLGPEGFFKGMNLYFKRHDGQAVTCEDFIKAMEDANDYSLKQFRLWYQQAGTPILDIQSRYEPKLKQLTLEIKQSCQDTPEQNNKKAFHIPLRLGLLDRSGKDIPLNISDESSLQGDILHINKASQYFVFNDVYEKPVLSLLRNFSAPVKVEYDYSNEELAYLYAHDSDPFNRWDAGQRLFANEIWRLYNLQQSKLALVLSDYLIPAVRELLSAENLDGQFKSLALSLPDLKSLIEMIDRLDIDSLIIARNFLQKAIAQELEMDWLLHYQANHHIGNFSQDKSSVAKRAFAGLCLSYLISLEKEQTYNLAINQMESANNMTDAINAFQLLMHSEYTEKKTVSDDFYQKWHKEELVVNKWLMVLSTAPQDSTLDKVNELLDHPAFEITNPNRVRSLIGAFANANMAQFHRKDGLGYEYLANQIKELYSVNPQTAARLTGAFNRWKKFDLERQQQIKNQLESILSLPDLSRDVYEIASKSLN